MKRVTQSNKLLSEIKKLVEESRQFIAKAINTQLLYTYWQVGKLIHEAELYEKLDDISVRQMLIELSKELTTDLGKGFSRSQLTYMRLFYLKFPVFNISSDTMTLGVTVSHQKKETGLTVSHQLSWSHYYEILKCNLEAEIRFYQHYAIKENWSVRELRRQIDAALFERNTLSENSRKLIKPESSKLNDTINIFKDPYVLEFLNIPENHLYNEKEFEQKIIDNLQSFILELGKGFAFIGRQYRITLNNTHFYLDLVFYHRILKCFVLIDLKVKNVKHQDIGQMNLYLNYFEAEQNVENDNPPIGIILTRYKDDVIVEYATRGISNNIFVSKYQLYLPDKKLLQKKVKEILDSEYPQSLT